MIGWWSNLPAATRRWIFVGGAGALMVGGMTFLPTEGKSVSLAERRRANLSENILTDSNTRKLGLESMNEQIRDLRSMAERSQKQLEHLTARAGVIEPDQVSKDLAQLKAGMTRLEQEQAKIKQAADLAVTAAARAKMDTARPAASGDAKAAPAKPDKGGDREPRLQPGDTPATPAPASAPAWQAYDPNDPSTLFSMGAPRVDQAAPSDPKKGKPEKTGAAEIRTVMSARPDAAAADAARKASNVAFYLPAGAIISGVLLTGIDAPTGKGAQKNPFPALVRVKHEAVLPNYFRADVKECFVLIGGYGDLSSERALLRGETLSCVRKDGRVVEASFPAFASGEDGKAGVRGRLVSKQGQMVANAMISGMLEGFSEAFDTDPVTILSTSTSDGTYTPTFNAEAVQGAAISGVGSSLEKISEFWLEMAEATFPVIEIDAGRRIDLIVSKGIAVRFLSPDELQRQRQQEAVAAAATAGTQRGRMTEESPFYDYGMSLGTVTPTTTRK